MSELSFTRTAIPAVTREAKPNPFTGVFPCDSDAIVVVVDGAKDSKAVKVATSQARKAAQAVDRTARVLTEQSGTKAKPVTTLTIWTVGRITRPRKPVAAAE